ncbi:MAG: DUF479 domain-containing protein [Crocinitomicaceae bacterium]|nr:DUF479 domain-containing protein [Crocinitomicaceae bacterium]
MNFLGHLYFSNNNLDLMVANLFGDFCKGKSYLSYPIETQRGVLLHREIDSYIDNHAEVLAVRKELYASLPKVSGIAIDLYFDHLLAKHWHMFHDLTLEDFLSLFYKHTLSINGTYPNEFVHFITKLRESQWMNHYPSAYGFQKSCEGVSRRLSFDNELKNAPKLILPYEAVLFKVFSVYMNDAQTRFNGA